MIRLVTRTDVHLSDKGPVSRTDDWATTVLDKLAQVGRVAEKVKAAAVLDNGDFFHIKSPSRNSHDLIRRVADLHADYPCPVYANVGNHDCVYGDIRYLDSQPMGVLFSTGVFKRCYGEHEAIFEQHGGCQPPLIVRVVGIPYHGTKYQMERFAEIRKGKEDYLVVMAHMLASPQGGSLFENEDIVKYIDLAGLDPEVFVFGHYHKDQGIVKMGNKVIVNVGSLTRGTLAQDDLERRPACTVLTFTKEKVDATLVRLRVNPITDIFDLDKKVREEGRQMTVEGFVEALKDTISDVRAKTLADAVREMPGIPEAVRERGLLYLERAS